MEQTQEVSVELLHDPDSISSVNISELIIRHKMNETLGTLAFNATIKLVYRREAGLLRGSIALQLLSLPESRGTFDVTKPMARQTKLRCLSFRRPIEKHLCAFRNVRIVNAAVMSGCDDTTGGSFFE